MPRIHLDINDVRKLPLTHLATIPEDYLDEMGHMNVMWYTHLFSLGMGGLFRRVELAWENVAEHQGGTFALEAHTRFLAEVRVGQQVEIRSRVLGRSEKRFYVMHIMTNVTKQNVAAIFETVGTYIDMRTRRTAPIPDSVAANFDAIIAEHAGLTWNAPVCGVMSP